MSKIIPKVINVLIFIALGFQATNLLPTIQSHPVKYSLKKVSQ